MVDGAAEGEAYPAEIESELKTVEQEMRRRGYRWTSQRLLVVKAAFSTHAHFTADELLVLCQEEDLSVSRATVYRMLSMLEDAGFVEGLDTGEGGRRFEHTLGHDHHDHMVCTKCGRIIEFFDQELERRQTQSAERLGFQIQSHSLKLFGVCRECQTSP